MRAEKILIFGGDGMAGSMIRQYLAEKGHDVISTTRRKPNKHNRIVFDAVQNIYSIKELIDKVKPSFVVNCIGVLNDFAEENKQNAILINSYLPHELNSLASKDTFKLVHISTDCVFTGEKGNYIETDVPDATSFYGKTKALGEVLEGNSITLRTSIVGPDPNSSGIGLFNWFMAESNVNNELRGYSKVWWSGVTTLQLAKSIEVILGHNLSGLYHLVNNKKINKFDLLNLFREHFNLDIQITEDQEKQNDKSLIDSRNSECISIPSYEDMVKEMADWVRAHKRLYPQYVSRGLN